MGKFCDIYHDIVLSAPSWPDTERCMDCPNNIRKRRYSCRQAAIVVLGEFVRCGVALMTGRSVSWPGGAEGRSRATGSVMVL